MSCKEESDEKLIDCVHNFPVIYDLSKKSYKDKIAKDNGRKNIATALERDGKFGVYVIFCSFYIVLVFKILATHKNNS